MNYYIIPKNNFNIRINPIIKPDSISPFISYSLIYFLNNMYSQLLNIEELNVDNNKCDNTNSLMKLNLVFSDEA